MNYKLLPQSWEKQSFWLLENGWTVIEEYNQVYGPFVKGLLGPGVSSPGDKDGPVWFAHNGHPPDGGAERANLRLNTKRFVDLPDFAKAWKVEHGLIRPTFKLPC